MSKVFAELVKLGLSEESAGDIAESLRSSEDLATKADLRTMHAEMKADLAELKAELFKHTTQTLVWTTGIFAGIVAIIVGLFRYLPS